MRYVIVCVVKGEAGNFNNHLRLELWEKLKVKSSKLPAHFTIKAPFEYDGEITDLEKALEDFCVREKAEPFILKEYDHFDDRVIYMKVDMSYEGKAVHDRLIDTLAAISYIKFDKKDGKEKIFHVTVSAKKLQPIYNQVWNYVQKYPFKFNCVFDNISIYKWEENTWKLYREFLMK